MNMISKALLITGVAFAANAFAMEASYDCVRAKSERFCNPCKAVRIPACCDRDATCGECPKWNYCQANFRYEKPCKPVCKPVCSPCGN